MTEVWKDIPGFEGRYQVSDAGNVKSLPFDQRYTHSRTGKELFRRTREKALAVQFINSGYLIVHLHKDGKRQALLVHRLVAAAFCPGQFDGADVNHKNGVKDDNRAANLEWVTRTGNHLHAVHHRLNKQAIPVVDPATGVRHDSINQAAKAVRKKVARVSASFLKADQLEEIL